jgi:hypothetical protein
MHPFINQKLARQHQETLIREAEHERMSSHVDEQAKGILAQPLTLQQSSLPEPDFAAIRRDLRSTLSEWSLESGSAGCEAVIDIFMRRLRMRLGYNEPGEDKRMERA